MGWYDSFKGNTNRVNIGAITDNRGSAFKNFGDAFSKIGANMYGAEMDKEKLKVDEQKINTLSSKEALNDFTLKETKKASTAQDVSNAFGKTYLGYEDKNAYATDTMDNPFKDVTAADIAKKDAYFKTVANDTGYKNALLAKVGEKDGMSLETWMQNNPNVDAATVSKVKSYIDAKDKTAENLKAQKAAVKNETKILKMQGKINKAGSGKDAFKYTEQTDAKIAAQVKTAMGMDAPDFSFSDAVKINYQNTVAGAAKISKAYNLEPSLAIHVYQNPDLYDLTADGKVIVKKVDKKEVTKKTSSWKDYQ